MPDVAQFIKEWASSHFGIVISDDKIETQIHRLIKSHELNEERYLQALAENQTTIVNDTIDALTVQESYFFRDAPLFLYLKNTLLPQLIKEKQKNGKYQLTIWSAGCACGEEIYSIAIYLDQLLPDIKQWKINLIATDIDEAALEKGRKAIFTKSSMRATDQETINAYFKPHPPASFALKPRIKNMVTFSYGNIIDHHGIIKCDLIFCRNVFIYLTQNAIEKALLHFYENLEDEGFLFLGPSDLISYYQHQFLVERTNNICHLKKTSQQCIKKTNPHDKVIPAQRPALPKASVSYIEQLQDKTNQLNTIRLLLDQKNYLTVLEKIDHYLSNFTATALLYRYKGEALIGLGDTATAMVFLEKSIQLDTLDAISYFLRGLVELDMKNHKAAVGSLQKALYIKSNFPEAAYHLGLLYIQNQQEKKGVKLLRQALIYAGKQSQEKPALCAQGTIAEFIEAIQASISYYQGRSHE